MHLSFFCFLASCSFGSLASQITLNVTTTSTQVTTSTADNPSTSAANNTQSTDANTPAATAVATTSFGGFATTPSLVSYATKFCTCDLIKNACDLNCCCDTDCTDADKTVFSKCTESTTDDSRQVCISKKVLFSINIQSGVNNSELFETSNERCVKKKDFEARNSIYVPVTGETDNFYQALLQNQNIFSYTGATTPEAIYPSNANYKIDDNILTLTANNDTSNFNLPFHSASSTTCVDGTPVVFLKDALYTCWREFDVPLSVACLAQDSLSAEYYLNSVRLFSLPYTETTIDEDLLVPINGNYSQTNYDPTTHTCLNAVTQVHYVVYHTGGVIKQVSAEITQENITLISNFTTSIQQKFSVAFLTSDSMISTIGRSGNPGYITGKPIISGQLTQSGESVSTDSKHFISTLGFKTSGECDSTAERHPILFGENTRSGCWLNNTGSSCNSTESTARNLLTEKTLTSLTYLSSLGNGTTGKLGDWVPLLHPSAPSYNSLQCSGLQMVLTILYSKIGSVTNPQNRITGASISYNLFEMMNPFNYHIEPDDSKFLVESVVRFLDVTQDTQDPTQETVYSQRSDVDFFYPFVYANEIET